MSANVSKRFVGWPVIEELVAAVLDFRQCTMFKNEKQTYSNSKHSFFVSFQYNY